MTSNFVLYFFLVDTFVEMESIQCPESNWNFSQICRQTIYLVLFVLNLKQDSRGSTKVDLILLLAKELARNRDRFEFTFALLGLIVAKPADDTEISDE